jgi:hypothetical protein
MVGRAGKVEKGKHTSHMRTPIILLDRPLAPGTLFRRALDFCEGLFFFALSALELFRFFLAFPVVLLALYKEF